MGGTGSKRGYKRPIEESADRAASPHRNDKTAAKELYTPSSGTELLARTRKICSTLDPHPLPGAPVGTNSAQVFVFTTTNNSTSPRKHHGNIDLVLQLQRQACEIHGVPQKARDVVSGDRCTCLERYLDAVLLDTCGSTGGASVRRRCQDPPGATEH